MDTFSRNHFNLDIDLISLVLIPHIEASIRYKIKECITSVRQEYGYTITKRKAFLGRKRALKIVYGDWDKSFASLPRYMAALQHFNPGTVVEWKLEQSPGIPEYIFRCVFWAFKLAIDSFVHCRPVISIDETHVYGKYNIKLLIDVAEPYAYHRYCVRHLKANFQKAHPNKDLHNLMWMAATDNRECKFRRRMESIRQEDEIAYHWLMRHELDKGTLHADGGRRWGTLTTNVLESFNGLLKSACGLPVTAMVWMSFKQIAERFVERHRGTSELMERGVEFMPIPMKKFEKYRRQAHWHSFLQYSNERNIFEVCTAIHQNRRNNTHTINEASRLCSWGKWSIYHMPCSHVMKYFQHTGFAATR
ncbi:uncharacterized protein [Nicotiana tomentosiformis]|uniref:uncharacterized protein n=1 Tax=Nicotiana tomentosiformis TaxID=4098 RepID=UPI00388CD394